MTNIIQNTGKLTAVIKQKALELGYTSCGITDASPFTEFLDGLEQRIQRYPESTHLYEALRQHGYPKKQAEWAESVIVCISRYGRYRLPQGLDRYFGNVFWWTDAYPTRKNIKPRRPFIISQRAWNVGVPSVLADRWAAAAPVSDSLGKITSSTQTMAPGS